MTIGIQKMTVENFMRVAFVSAKLDGESVVFGGLSTQGKTTLLRAAQLVFGGAREMPAEPQNRNATDPARVEFILTNGWRAVCEGKNLTLKVYDEAGEKMTKGRTALDEFVSKFAINLPLFLEGKNTQANRNRSEILLETMGIGDQLKAIDATTKDLEEQRQKHHPIYLLKKEAAKDAAYFPDAPDAPTPVKELTEKLDEANRKNQQNERFRVAINQKRGKLAQNEKDLSRLKDEAASSIKDAEELAGEIKALRLSHADEMEKIRSAEVRKQTEYAELEMLREELAKLQAKISGKEVLVMRESSFISSRKEIAASLVASIDSKVFAKESAENAAEHGKKQIERLRFDIETAQAELVEDDKTAEQLQDIPIDSISEQINALEETNRKANANAERLEKIKQAAEESDIRERFTEQIEESRKRRNQLLMGAKFPLPELSIDENYVLTWNGIPWPDMATSEQYKAAIAICAKTSPGFKVVLADGLEALDPFEQRKILEYANSVGMQLIATRVTTNSEECSFMIEDGAILMESE